MDAQGNDRWLSKGAEALIEEIENSAADIVHCEVLIVGSGYGGAVAAARLAGATRKADGAPAKVYVLERGEEYLPGEFPATFAEVAGHVRFSRQDGEAARGRAGGLFDLRIGKDVNVLLGNGLGGGSLINAAVMEEATADAFLDPRWPDSTRPGSLDAYYEKARRMLEPAQLPGTVPKFESLMAAGRALAVRHPRKAWLAVSFDGQASTPAGVATCECLKCGDCVSGCNHGAKKSLDLNYLAMAQANGAELFCGATVHRVRACADEGYEVDFFLTDPKTAGSDRARPHTVRARRVILAAGSLGSTEILMRSQRDGLALGGKLGANFSTNGDLIAAAHRQNRPAPSCGEEGVAPDARGIGPTITGLLRHFTTGRPIVIEEFGIPAPLRRLFAEVVTSVGALHGLAQRDRSEHFENESMVDPLAVSDEAMEHTVVYGMMGDDGAAGHLELAGREDAPMTDAQVRVSWSGVGGLPLFEEQMAALHTAHDSWPIGLGGRVLPNPAWQPFPPVGPLAGFRFAATTVHPLGGCPMAERRSDGVVDSHGRVFADSGPQDCTLDGLAVLDGSIVPAALGINPALTIAALAERAIERLVVEWDLVPRRSTEPQRRPRPVRRDLKHPAPPLPTMLALHERLHGEVLVGGRPFTLEATVAFEPVGASALRKLPRTLAQDTVCLRFTDASGGRSVVRCGGKAQLLVREHSTQQQRVSRSFKLAQRKLKLLLGGSATGVCDLLALRILCSHLGQARLIRYQWTVLEAGPGAPLNKGQELRLTKRLAFTEGGNPWRQLSEGDLELSGSGHLGRLALDLGYFVEQLTPLLRIESQQDAPNALGDLAELALWVLRLVLHVHLINFLPPDSGSSKADERLPAAVDNIDPELIEVPHADGATTLPERRLSRYLPANPAPGSRPVMLVHGYGASGSTFAHHSIPRNLVSALMDAGREVWVLDLRTSIGLEQRCYWSFEDVALGDIPQAVLRVLQGREEQKLDVIAHCIGAAMFSVAALGHESMCERIGAVILSQVGPLLRASPMNRFRGYLASYLQEYIQVKEFDVRPPDEGAIGVLLADLVLSTFPYPDGDGEAQRLEQVPGFARVRHRADGIYGQTMRLANVGDATLEALDAIYGWVTVRGLAQVSHYAREQLLTDAGGLNRVVTQEHIGQRFNFPVLLLHGRRNAVFDWRGAWDCWRLLQAIFDPPADPRSVEPYRRIDPPAAAGDLLMGQGTPRRLVVLADYGHQDCLIGEHASRDVFPHMLSFLKDSEGYSPAVAKAEPPLRVELPWLGPMLGRAGPVTGEPELLRCRISLRPPPARASTLAVVYVPARRCLGGWKFVFEGMVGELLSSDDLKERALEVDLHVPALPGYDGFAVVTVHNDLPLIRKLDIKLWRKKPRRLFHAPDLFPPRRIRHRVMQRLLDGDDGECAKKAIDAAVVRLDPAWIRAALTDAQDPAALSFALASCQYPPGLLDALPAQRSCVRMAQLLDTAPTGARPQWLMLTGDQVYVDQAAGLFEPSVDAVERAYTQGFGLDAWRAVTRRLPTCAILDDHEVGDNWEPGALPKDQEDAGLAAYREYLHKGAADPKSMHLSYGFRAAGFPFVVLDTRARRQRRALRSAAGAKLLGEALINEGLDAAGLAALFAHLPLDRPVFIVSPVALLPLPRKALFSHGAERLGLDDWSGYPRSQFDLIEQIRRGPARQVVLLSGDRHMSSVSSLWLKGDHGPVEIISIVSSGLYAPWPFANSRPDEFWLEGPVSMRFGARSIEGRVLTAAIGTSDGFAVVRVERTQPGGWSLHVTLDLAEGAQHCRRSLARPGDTRWMVDGSRGSQVLGFDIGAL